MSVTQVAPLQVAPPEMDEAATVPPAVGFAVPVTVTMRTKFAVQVTVFLNVAGVAMVQLSDIKATWDFLVVWQRGRTAKSLRALLDALAATAKSCEPISRETS